MDAGAPPETGLLRLRFVTSHPRDITRELVETVASLPRVCRHFHMPAQSGSDRILHLMRRGYGRGEYEERLAMIREVIPGAAVASDFIVGFPGENENDFLATLDLVETAGFQNSYIFKYSPRPGTPAARGMADDVPEAEKKRRHQELLAAQNRVNARRAESLVGSRQVVMAEGPSLRDPARWTGRTDANLIAVFDSPAGDERLAGELVELSIYAATPLTLFGRRERRRG